MQCLSPSDPRVVEHRALARRRRAWPLSGDDEARYVALTRELVREMLAPTSPRVGAMQHAGAHDDPAPR